MVDSKSSDTLIDTVCNVEPALRSVDQKQVYNATVMYLFRGLNQAGYAARLKRLTGQKINIKALTEALTYNGAITKNFKVWLFYVVKNKLNRQQSLELARRWELSMEEFDATINMSKATLIYLRRLGRKYTALTLETLDNNIARIINNIKVWLGKFVSKKHRFIYQREGGRGDVHNELTLQGIRGLLFQYPLVENKLHAENVVKRVIHNQGVNLIYKHTTQKAGRLTTEADGTHQARVVGLNEAHLNELSAPVNHSQELRLDIEMFMKNLRVKQRRFVELLCGGHSPSFTRWLNEVHGVEVETNEQLLDKIRPGRYMILVLEHLQVSVEAGRKFVRKLQRVFANYTSKSFTQWTVLENA